MNKANYAVMSQRHEQLNGLDDFPTPPWATRALLSFVLKAYDTSKLICREPACGRGYMSDVLSDHFAEVWSSDINDYGYGTTIDYLNMDLPEVDWVITNPPFNLAEKFIFKALKESRIGVAVLLRTVFLESVGRYERLFSQQPPSIVAQFVERVPMIKGRLDKHAKSATGYAWFVWEKDAIGSTNVVWIPPCRRNLERQTDY